MDVAYLLMDDTFYLITRSLIAIKSDYTGQRCLGNEGHQHCLVCNIPSEKVISSSADNFLGWDLTLCCKSVNRMMMVHFDFRQLELYRCQGEDSLPGNT